MISAVDMVMIMTQCHNKQVLHFPALLCDFSNSGLDVPAADM